MSLELIYRERSKQLEAEVKKLRTERDEAKRLLRLAIGVMSFEDLGKIPGIRVWLKIDGVRK